MVNIWEEKEKIQLTQILQINDNKFKKIETTNIFKFAIKSIDVHISNVGDKIE